MVFFYEQVPKKYTNGEDMLREHSTCRVKPMQCPKGRNKCRISQYCYLVKDE